MLVNIIYLLSLQLLVYEGIGVLCKFWFIGIHLFSVCVLTRLAYL